MAAKILIIEDDTDINNLLARIMQGNCGWRWSSPAAHLICCCWI